MVLNLAQRLLQHAATVLQSTSLKTRSSVRTLAQQVVPSVHTWPQDQRMSICSSEKASSTIELWVETDCQSRRRRPVLTPSSKRSLNKRLHALPEISRWVESTYSNSVAVVCANRSRIAARPEAGV